MHISVLSSNSVAALYEAICRDMPTIEQTYAEIAWLGLDREHSATRLQIQKREALLQQPTT